MKCPGCDGKLTGTDTRCPDCDYGVAIKPPPPVRGPRYLGDTPGETRDEELARTFHCSNCRSKGGNVKRIATTGAGLSRLFDLQRHELIVVSCRYCGIVQMYDPSIVDRVSSGWPIIDLLTGN